MPVLKLSRRTVYVKYAVENKTRKQRNFHETLVGKNGMYIYTILNS